MKPPYSNAINAVATEERPAAVLLPDYEWGQTQILHIFTGPDREEAIQGMVM